ncbi:uncharacterized protein [Miscanthus floridulus]|uniref:uncharacterized protein n=1 Tax=Miscanthus floridulus TaxID=154761 RepID=UPI0034577BCA
MADNQNGMVRIPWALAGRAGLHTDRRTDRGQAACLGAGEGARRPDGPQRVGTGARRRGRTIISGYEGAPAGPEGSRGVGAAGARRSLGLWERAGGACWGARRGGCGGARRCGGCGGRVGLRGARRRLRLRERTGGACWGARRGGCGGARRCGGCGGRATSGSGARRELAAAGVAHGRGGLAGVGWGGVAG